MHQHCYKRLCCVSFLLLFYSSQRGTAQDASCQHRSLPVSFRDSQNLPIQDITPPDLEGRIHGKPVKILSLAPDPRPHRVVLILDTSGSTGSTAGESPLWPLELNLAADFFVTNQQRARLALLLFNERVYDEVDFSSGNPAVGNELQRIATDRDFVKKNIKGRTALRDAIFQGLQLFDHPTSADAIYVLTDGGENASTHKESDLNQRLAITSVRLFAVLVYGRTGFPNRTREEISGPRDLAEIAERSGGEILTAAERRGDTVALSANAEAKLRTQEVLGRLYQTILEDKLLEAELPSPITKNEHWEVKLSDAARKRWKDAQITYPKVLISCNSEVVGSGRN